MQLALPFIYEVIDLVKDIIWSDTWWEMILAHEDVGDEVLTELALSLGMAHEDLVPAEARRDEPVRNVTNHTLCLVLDAAMADQQCLNVSRDRSQAFEFCHLLLWLGDYL